MSYKWEHHGIPLSLTINGRKIAVKDPNGNTLQYDCAYFQTTYLEDSQGNFVLQSFQSLPEPIRKFCDPDNVLETYDGTKHKFAVSPKITKTQRLSKKKTVPATKKKFKVRSKRSLYSTNLPSRLKKKTYKGTKKSIRY